MDVRRKKKRGSRKSLTDDELTLSRLIRFYGFSLKEAESLELDEVDMFCRAMNVLKSEEFNEGTLISSWPKIDKKDRQKVTSEYRKSVRQAMGENSKEKALGSDDLKRFLMSQNVV